ncbi:MAG: dicarboxylate/amino acid:cation symporter, partial [Alistipes sp.]|nr:dicarboxylate/amino acid:cation symporter [Alistipes sp.]
IPILIVGLVIPSIAEIGSGAGRMLALTALLAYGSTVVAGFVSYFTGAAIFPHPIDSSAASQLTAQSSTLTPYFSVQIPPLMDVMTALVIAFMFGLGLAYLKGDRLREASYELREVVVMTIDKVVIPLLPLFIFCIFYNMAASGEVFRVMSVFVKIIAVIFVLHVLWLVALYIVAGVTAGKNPFKMLKTMLPAYFTALGTQSSAATIPVTLAQAKKMGVSDEVAGFVVPLCATIHLSGSMLKIVACALALMMMQGLEYDFTQIAGFIFMLGITMVAAPGVPGGAIMAALGVLTSMLGFSPADQALMISLYIAMDSFGTACNVTGDGALAMIVNRFKKN